MPTKRIPDEIKNQVEARIAAFNREVIQNPSVFYVPRYKGMFLYLDRSELGRVGRICRLEYTGKIDGWKFAIYKYSDEEYDPGEWMFPGSQHVDGTVEGAMRAGMAAYPF